MENTNHIISSLDYKSVINHFFKLRISNNPKYSLRKYAADLQLSPSSLSELLNNKHVPSVMTARKIAVNLNLTKEESEHFIDLALLQSPYSDNLRNESMKRIQMRQDQQSKILN
jgi:transcriptional regulator with XRE-family HTH domain